MATTDKEFLGTGRRKTAVARVRLYPGNGAVVVNGKPLEDVFSRDSHRAEILSPLTRLGRQLLTKLKVFKGPKHPHAAQQPAALAAAK